MNGRHAFSKRTAAFYSLGANLAEVVKGADQFLELVEMPQYFQQELASTVSELRSTYPEVWRFFDRVVEDIAFVKGPLVIGSSPRAFGLLFVSAAFFAKNLQERVEYLVHELIHHDLYLINLVDPLFTAASHIKFAYSPIAGKDRPVHGRFHAAYVFYRLKKLSIFTHKNKALLERTLATLSRKDFTDFGKALFDVISEVESQYIFPSQKGKLDMDIFKNNEYGCQRFVAVPGAMTKVA